MNNDLISREAVKAVVKNRLGTMDLFESRFNADIDAIPAVDAVEVVHAKWKLICNNGVYEQGCTNCGFFPGIRFWSSDYCPNCGAKME